MRHRFNPNALVASSDRGKASIWRKKRAASIAAAQHTNNLGAYMLWGKLVQITSAEQLAIAVAAGFTIINN